MQDLHTQLTHIQDKRSKIPFVHNKNNQLQREKYLHVVKL